MLDEHIPLISVRLNPFVVEIFDKVSMYAVVYLYVVYKDLFTYRIWKVRAWEGHFDIFDAEEECLAGRVAWY